jgi:hypothetical protein
MMTRFMVAVFAVGASACALDPAADRRDPRALDEEQAGSRPETATAVTPGDPAPPPAACITPPNLQNEVVADAAVNGASIQRCCPSAACTSQGALQPTDDALYFCWTVGDDGSTWTFLRNLRTGVQGWVRDNLLRNNGSSRFCGF